MESVRIDTIAIGFSILVALAAAFLAALIPSLLPLRADLSSGLKNGAKMTSGSAGISGRGALVVAQVALAVTVIAAAGLLIRSVARLQRVELGLPAERLVLVELQVPQTNLKDRHRHAQFLNDVVARLDAVPVISSVTPVNLAPFSGQGWDVPRITGEGQDAGQAERNPSLNLESIHPNYFATLQVPIVHGRAFIDADRAGVADVAILSQDLAERLWPGENPVGKRLKMGDLAEKSAWYTVVGVAGSTRYRELIRQHPTLYLAAAQFQMTATMLVVRTTASLELVQALARDSIQAVDPGVRVMRVASFGELLGRPLARPTFNAFILAIFGALALALSTIGLYAVMAAYVRQREREIAIRLAVGATAARIRQFVLAETMRLAGLGAIVGAGGAVAASPLLRGLLFDVDPLDPPTIVVAALLLVAAATLASYVPVRRATRVDAATMLRGQ